GCGPVARGQHDSAYLRSSISARRRLAWHRRSRECYQRVCGVGRDGHHGPTPAFESSAFVDHLCCRVRRAALVNSALWTIRRCSRYSSAVCRSGHSALRDAAMGFSLERFLERHQTSADRCRNRNSSRSGLPGISNRNCRTGHQRCGVPGSLRDSVVAAPPPSQGQPGLVRREYVPAIAEERDRLVVVVLTPFGVCHTTVRFAVAATRYVSWLMPARHIFSPCAC